MKIELNNDGCCRSNVYYPRLMVNRQYEIVLAMSQHNGLTTGIYMGQADEHEPHWPIGKRFDDWEVAGQLVDYDGPVTVTFENKVKKQ